MPLDRSYWESLDVCIDDITDLERTLGNKISKRLANKFGENPDLEIIIKDYYNVSGDSLSNLLTSLNSKSKEQFQELYAIAIFASKRISPEIIYEIASNRLEGVLATRASKKVVDPNALLLPLFKKNANTLMEIFYEHLFQCKSFKRYKCQPELKISSPFKKLDKNRMDIILQTFEKSQPDPRPIKCWWIDHENDNLRLVFRRERKAHSHLKMVLNNSFIKTADEKFFVFKKDGNILELCSRAPQQTLDIAESIIKQVTDQTVEYYELINRYKLSNLDNFINRILSNQIPDITLTKVRVRNAPVVNSPTIEVACKGSSIPSLNDLNEKHSLRLIKNSADIESFRIKIQGRYYTLRSDVEGDNVSLLSDNRNIREKDKEKLSLFLDEHIG